MKQSNANSDRFVTTIYLSRDFVTALDYELLKRKETGDVTLKRNDLILEALQQWAQRQGISKTPFY